MILLDYLLFLRALAVARISYGNSFRLFVRLSVCHDPVLIGAQVR